MAQQQAEATDERRLSLPVRIGSAGSSNDLCCCSAAIDCTCNRHSLARAHTHPLLGSPPSQTRALDSTIHYSLATKNGETSVAALSSCRCFACSTASCCGWHASMIDIRRSKQCSSIREDNGCCIPHQHHCQQGRVHCACCRRRPAAASFSRAHCAVCKDRSWRKSCASSFAESRWEKGQRKGKEKERRAPKERRRASTRRGRAPSALHRRDGYTTFSETRISM